MFPKKKKACTREMVLVAIIGTGGIKSKIAKKLAVTRETVNNYIKGDDVIAKAYDDECEAVGDICESKLVAKIRKGNMQAITFYAKTKLKNRGYVERTETTGKDGGPLGLVVADSNEVSDEILLKIALKSK